MTVSIELLLAPVLLCAVFWVRAREAAIVREGEPLTVNQLALARALNVAEPARVRVMAVRQVPMPLPRTVRRAAQRLGWLSPHIAGMTLGYGIVLRHDVWGDQRLLAHELAHVAQYERLGRFYGFLRQYMRECIWPGYPHGALEIEARRAEAAVSGTLDFCCRAVYASNRGM